MQFPKLNTLLVLYSLIASHPAIAVETSQIRTLVRTSEQQSFLAIRVLTSRRNQN
jgi:hypothetical protein